MRKSLVGRLKSLLFDLWWLYEKIPHKVYSLPFDLTVTAFKLFIFKTPNRTTIDNNHITFPCWLTAKLLDTSYVHKKARGSFDLRSIGALEFEDQLERCQSSNYKESWLFDGHPRISSRGNMRTVSLSVCARMRAVSHCKISLLLML